MLEHLYEINRILLSINNLFQANKGSKLDDVIDDLAAIAISARSSHHNQNINECVNLGIIKHNQGRLFITSKGQLLFSLRTMHHNRTNIDLNQEQKNYVLELLFDSSAYKKDLETIISSLRFDYKDKIWFYPVDVPSGKWSKNVTNLLFQTKFFVSKSDRILVGRNKSYYVSKIRHKVARSEETLMKILEKQRKVGAIAEQLTMNYENDRLEKDGYSELALSIQCISREDVFAGYDILSYNGKDSTLSHDRVIEVKGTAGMEPIFYWSKNEIEKAKQHKNKYWIYLWTEVKSKESSFDGVLFRTIQDPYSTFFLKKAKKPEPVLYTVEL